MPIPLRFATLRRFAVIALLCGSGCSGDLVIQAPDGLDAAAVLGVIWTQDLTRVRSVRLQEEGVLVDRLEPDEQFALYGLRYGAQELGLDQGPLPLPAGRGRRAPITSRYLLDGNQWTENVDLSAPLLPPFAPHACWSRGECAVRSCDGCAEDEDFALCGPCAPAAPTRPTPPSRGCPAGWNGEERPDGMWFCAPPPVAPELGTPCPDGSFRTYRNLNCREIAACENANWPEAPAGMTAIYIDASAPSGGDGSAALPYRDVASAGARLSNVALLLKPGRYPAALRLDDAQIIGSGTCTELTALNTTHTVALDGASALRNLRITSSAMAAVWIKPDASLTANAVEFVSTATHAIVVAGEAHLSHSAVRVPGIRDGGGAHYAVLVEPAARFECEACALSGGYGVLAHDGDNEVALSDIHYVAQSPPQISTHVVVANGDNAQVTATEVRALGSPAAFSISGADARLTLSDCEFWHPEFITDMYSISSVAVRGFKPEGEFGIPAYADIRRVAIKSENRGIDIQDAVLEVAEDWSIDSVRRPVRVDGLREPVPPLRRMWLTGTKSDHLAAVGLRNLTFEIQDGWLSYGAREPFSCTFDDGLVSGLGLSPKIVLRRTQLHLRNAGCVFARSRVELYDVKLVGLQANLLGDEFGLSSLLTERVDIALDGGSLNFGVGTGNLSNLTLTRSPTQDRPALCLGTGQININRLRTSGGIGPAIRLLAESKARLTDVVLEQDDTAITFETADACDTAIGRVDEPSPKARLERTMGQVR